MTPPPQLTLPESVSQYLSLTGRALKRCRAIPHVANITNSESKALSKLTKNKEIVVTKADKEDTVVVLDIKQYTELAYRHLNDADTYEKLTKNPTRTIAKGF